MKLSDYMFLLTGKSYANQYSKYLGLGDEALIGGKFIEDKIGTLNHLGIGYTSKNFIETMQKLEKDLDYKLYEEESGNPYNHWLFMEAKPKSEVWFEHVINVANPDPKWARHVQIDIDTKLEHEEILSRFGKPDWTLDIPNYGVVLDMYLIGKYQKVNLFLGLGTNLRNTALHRKSLKKII